MIPAARLQGIQRKPLIFNYPYPPFPRGNLNDAHHFFRLFCAMDLTLIPRYTFLINFFWMNPTMSLVIDEQELKRLPVTIDQDILSGAPVFQGTRVPVDALITNLEAGLTLDAFLENFPSVTREQALQVLAFSKSTLLKLAHKS
jgi:uncharacterized protein (DUF433 family)